MDLIPQLNSFNVPKTFLAVGLQEQRGDVQFIANFCNFAKISLFGIAACVKDATKGIYVRHL